MSGSTNKCRSGKWDLLLTSEGLASTKKPTIGENSFPSLHPEEEKTTLETNNLVFYEERETKRATNNSKKEQYGTKIKRSGNRTWFLQHKWMINCWEKVRDAHSMSPEVKQGLGVWGSKLR